MLTVSGSPAVSPCLSLLCRIFVGYQWVMFALMALIAHLIPNESSAYRIQLQRATFILSKLIDRVPDDEEDIEVEQGADGDDGPGGGPEDGDVELSSSPALILQSNPMLTSSPLAEIDHPTHQA
jgi:hypothetical protein